MEWSQNNETQIPRPMAAGRTLRYVVMNVLNRVQSNSMHEYKRLMQFAIDCVRDELRLYHAASLEIFYTKVSETGIVQMPPDCLSYTKIGVNVAGQLFILGLNENIVLNRATKCGANVDDIIRTGLGAFAPTDGYYFVEHMNPSGAFIGGLYGLGGGFVSPSYRWDEKFKRFQLNGPGLLNKEVIVEYKSTGLSSGTIIEPELIAPIRNYILWQRIENDPRVPANEKERKERQYDQSIEKMRFYRSNFTLQEFYDVFYRNLKQTPKR